MPKLLDIFNNPYFQQYQQAAGVGLDALQGIGEVAGAIQGGMPSFSTDTPIQQSVGDRPVYNLGMVVSEAGGFNKKNYGRGVIGQGAGAGLKVGLNPTLLAATGGLSAPIGAAAGAVAGLFGRRRARNKAEEMQAIRTANIEAAQSDFNEASADYNQNYLARQQYEQLFR